MAAHPSTVPPSACHTRRTTGSVVHSYTATSPFLQKALVEGIIPAALFAEKNPAAEWQQYFGENSQPVADARAYPPFAEVREKYLQLRERNLNILESLTEVAKEIGEVSDQEILQTVRAYRKERRAPEITVVAES